MFENKNSNDNSECIESLLPISLLEIQFTVLPFLLKKKHNNHSQDESNKYNINNVKEVLTTIYGKYTFQYI